LESLCATYWYPLYVFARRQGNSREQSEDLTQEFFARLLDQNYLDRADPERGRFRAFLLTAFKRFLVNDWTERQTLKRGGGRTILSLNFDAAESRLACEPWHAATPARAFERAWAITLLNRVLELLEREFEEKGRSGRFARLKQYLSGEDPADYQQLAQELEMTPSSLRVAVHRLRQRYGDLLRQEIGHTVADPQEFEQELSLLMDAVRNPD